MSRNQNQNRDRNNPPEPPQVQQPEAVNAPAVSQAAVPEPAQPAAKAGDTGNRFLDHLFTGDVSFVANVAKEPRELTGQQKGTKRQKVADAFLMLRGCQIPLGGCIVVRDVLPNGASGFVFQFPRTGSGFYSKKVIAVPKEDDAANMELKAAGAHFEKLFREWAKQQPKGTFKVSKHADADVNMIPASPEEMNDMGFD